MSSSPTDDDNEMEQELIDILNKNKLYKYLYQILCDNDVDLDQLRNDIEIDDIGGYTQTTIQKTKFKKLLRIIKKSQSIKDKAKDNDKNQNYDAIKDVKYKKFFEFYKLPTILYHNLVKQDIKYDQLDKLTERHIDVCCNPDDGITIGAEHTFRDAINQLKMITKHKDEIYTNEPDYKIEVILIGNSGTGKTSLINRYCKDIFNPFMLATHGIGDMGTKREVLSDGSVMQIKIWDTAGQENHGEQNVCKLYYKKADLIIFCYDLANDNYSLDTAKKWLKRIDDNAKKGVMMLIVGCKSEATQNSKSEKIVTQRILPNRKWKVYNPEHIKCSAKTGDNVSNVFRTAAEKMLPQVKKKNKPKVREVIKIEHSIRCTKCNGTGFVQCGQCNKGCCKKCDPLNNGGICTKCENMATCFASDSYVFVYPNYVKKQIDELKIYDKILTYNEANNSYFWDELLVKYHCKKNEFLHNELVSMIQFTVKNNESLTMTGSHLLYVNDNHGLQRADSIKIGDKLKHYNKNNIEVISIKYVMKYPRNLLTYNGNLVINGCAISTFTESIKGESIYFGKSLRYIMNNYHQYNFLRYPFYYIAKMWREYVADDVKQSIAKFYFSSL